MYIHSWRSFWTCCWDTAVVIIQLPLYLVKSKTAGLGTTLPKCWIISISRLFGVRLKEFCHISFQYMLPLLMFHLSYFLFCSNICFTYPRLELKVTYMLMMLGIWQTYHVLKISNVIMSLLIIIQKVYNLKVKSIQQMNVSIHYHFCAYLNNIKRWGGAK